MTMDCKRNMVIGEHNAEGVKRLWICGRTMANPEGVSWGWKICVIPSGFGMDIHSIQESLQPFGIREKDVK